MFRRGLLPLVTIGVVTGAVGGMLFLSSSPVSWDDGLRHITMARVMQQEGVNQTWSRFFYGGYFAQHPVDPWFLADISYLPFTMFSDAVALRLYSILAIAALLGALWRVLAPLKLPRLWLSMLLLLGIMDPGFFGRLLLGRPFVWGSVFSLLILDAVLRRQALAAFAVLLLATLFSQLFVFPFVVAGAGTLWLLLSGKRRDALKLAACSFLGVGAGVLLHPHALEYALYLGDVFLRIPFASSTLSLGSEMHPSMSGSAPVALLGVTALLFVGALKEKSVRFADVSKLGTPLVLGLIVPFFWAYMFAWMRAVDLLWPLLVVLLGHVLLLARTFSEDLFDVDMKPLLPKIRGGTLVAWCIVLAFAGMVLRTAEGLRITDAERSLSHVAVLASLPDGARILSPEWAFFPPYIAANPRLRYATGIDNTFTWKTSPEAYNLFEVYYSLAAQIPSPVLDVRAWMRQLLAIYPSDYFVVSKQWGERLLPVLRTTKGLSPLTQSGDLIEVFSIDQKQFATSTP
jgi:hypothetical protein